MMRQYFVDILKRSFYWVLPNGIYRILTSKMDPNAILTRKLTATAARLSKKNIQIKNIHRGGRCFILCNGPSIIMQNISQLKNEYVFSVSRGYFHKDYNTIKPQYHCLPQLTYTDYFTHEHALSLLREIDEKIGDASIFINYTEEKLVNDFGLFKNRKVFYLTLGGGIDENRKDIIDICHIAPAVQSVPIMALIIAMYMGFSTIYLLGTEHDSFATGYYRYFYDNQVTSTDFAVATNGDIRCTLYQELRAYTILWEQYLHLNNIAESNGIKIFNATQGGKLDVFERVDFDTLFIQKN